MFAYVVIGDDDGHMACPPIGLLYIAETVQHHVAVDKGGVGAALFDRGGRRNRKNRLAGIFDRYRGNRRKIPTKPHPENQISPIPTLCTGKHIPESAVPNRS